MKLMLNSVPSKHVFNPTLQNKLTIKYKLNVIRYIYATRVESGQISGCLVSGFESFEFGSDQISGRLILDHLGFRVIRVWIGPSFELSDFGSSRVLGRLGSNQIGF
jgi:hypothetical protein